MSLNEITESTSVDEMLKTASDIECKIQGLLVEFINSATYKDVAIRRGAKILDLLDAYSDIVAELSIRVEAKEFVDREKISNRHSLEKGRKALQDFSFPATPSIPSTYLRPTNSIDLDAIARKLMLENDK